MKLRNILFCIGIVWVGLASASGSQRLFESLAREMDVPTPQSAALLQWVDRAAHACESSNFSLVSSINCMRHEVYDSLAVTFDSTADHNPADLLPSHLLVTRRGSCIPVTFLVLLLADRMGITAQPVSLPGHVYLNFPAAGINWEPNRQGFRYSDDEYRQKYALDPGMDRMAHRLDGAEFEGMLRYEAGNRLLATHQLDAAMDQYQSARTLWHDPRVAGNMALALDAKGDSAGCLRLLDSLWIGGARSEELVWNKALAMLRNHKSTSEVQIFLQEAEGRRIESKRLQDLAEKLSQVKE